MVDWGKSLSLIGKHMTVVNIKNKRDRSLGRRAGLGNSFCSSYPDLTYVQPLWALVAIVFKYMQRSTIPYKNNKVIHKSSTDHRSIRTAIDFLGSSLGPVLSGIKGTTILVDRQPGSNSYPNNEGTYESMLSFHPRRLSSSDPRRPSQRT